MEMHVDGALGRIGMQMPATHHCASPRCARLTVTCCFECDRPYCREHLTPLQLRLPGHVTRFYVCSACLITYLKDPDVRRIVLCAINDDLDSLDC